MLFLHHSFTITNIIDVTFIDIFNYKNYYTMMTFHTL